MARENILTNKYFIVFREQEIGSGGDTYPVPDWTGLVHGEVADGWLCVSAVRMPDLQQLNQKIVKIEALQNAEFFGYDEHFKRVYKERLQEGMDLVPDLFTSKKDSD